MRIPCLLAACLFIASTTLVLAEETGAESSADLKAMQGKWSIKKIDDGSGNAPPPEVLKMMWFEIQKDQMTPRTGKKLKQNSATLKLDSSKQPQWVDLIGFGQKPVESPDGGEAKMIPNPIPVLGIYELKGDELSFCLSGPGAAEGERPTEFKAVGGEQQLIIVLERKKK